MSGERALAAAGAREETVRAGGEHERRPSACRAEAVLSRTPQSAHLRGGAVQGMPMTDFCSA